MKSRAYLFLPVLALVITSSRPVYRYFFPEGGSTKSLVAKLNSSNSETVGSGYYYLTERVNPVAIDKAKEHLSSEDDYIWLNAALYLGACGSESSVPFLIKALRHTAWRSDENTVAYLQAITGQDFEADFGAWKSWWDASGREVHIDWTSKLGHNPRTTDAEQVRESDG